jgi:UbiD family decarboxylase
MIDTEKFRLRHFVEKLVQQGECVVHDDPIDLIDVAAVLDCNPRAVWFRAVGPEKAELVGNVMGTRRRLAAALDTDEPGFPTALRERLRHPVAPIEVPSAQAPVHEVVLTGDDADLTTLPVHLQHGPLAFSPKATWKDPMGNASGNQLEGRGRALSAAP